MWPEIGFEIITDFEVMRERRVRFSRQKLIVGARLERRSSHTSSQPSAFDEIQKRC
jgi:hypothetical protein